MIELFSIPGLTEDQQLTLLIWAVLGSFILLLILGMTNRVVVFYNGGDFAWTLFIFLGPVIGGLVGITLVPEGREFVGEPAAMISAYVGIGFGALSALVTLFLSIKRNGLILGIIVGVFKIASALLIVLCAFGLLNKIFGRDGAPLATRLTSMFLFGILMWMTGKLINGDEVTARRQRNA